MAKVKEKISNDSESSLTTIKQMQKWKTKEEQISTKLNMQL